jgi:hypothetical protein
METTQNSFKLIQLKSDGLTENLKNKNKTDTVIYEVIDSCNLESQIIILILNHY